MQPHILIIDEAEELTKVLAEYFTQIGYRVTEANSPQGGREKLEAGADLIILELSMEGNFRAGLDFLGKIRSEKDETPVILVSMYIDQEFMGEVPYDHVAGVCKPIRLAQLNQLVSMMLNRTG